MMAATRTLPLGVDIGRHRIRVALAVGDGTSASNLINVAVREHDGDLTAALVEAVKELCTRERRCVLALGAPDALLCTLPLPPMPRWERLRAARFEATRFVDYPIAEAALSLVPRTEKPGWVLGIARRAALSSALKSARLARLRPIAVDDVSFALKRAHPDAECAVDLGADATRVVVFTEPVPAVVTIPTGGRHLTEAIARSLGIDLDAAEQRKRRTGFGGAGESERDVFVAAIASAIADAGRAAESTIERIVLCGNGARIPGFDRSLAAATGARVSLGALPSRTSDRLPADVLRTAGPDWAVAYGLSLWTRTS